MTTSTLQLDPQAATLEVAYLADLLRALHPQCVDVGAHRGLVSRALADIGLRVLAIEANPVVAEQFRERQAELLRSKQVKLISCAASDRDAKAKLYVGRATTVSSLEDEWTKVGFPEEFENKTAVSVPARRLADVIRQEQIGAIGFLKIDVEGHELPAMKGYFEPGVPTPSVVLFEAFSRFPNEAAACLEFLGVQGYSRFDAIVRVGADLEEIERFDRPELPRSWQDREGTLFYVNFVAYHDSVKASNLPEPEQFLERYQQWKAGQ